MQESASDRDREKFKKLLEIIVVCINNMLATPNDNSLIMMTKRNNGVNKLFTKRN